MKTSTCPLCRDGRTPADARGLAWSSHHEPGGTVTWICPGCTRAQLRQIEAGLPLERADAPRTVAA